MSFASFHGEYFSRMDDRFGPVERFAALRFANELEVQPLPWLWPQRIPLGKVTLLVGDPGVGKSLLAADLGARVSAALPWPDDPPCGLRVCDQFSWAL